jgi:phosphoribosylpyrophosphate synthetase
MADAPICQEGRLASFIKEQSWFFSDWMQDPTINSMLRTISGDVDVHSNDNIVDVFAFKDLELCWTNLTQKNIITFEAHGDHKKVKSYSLASLFKEFSYDVVVSPDEGGVKRSENYSKVLKCDNYHFVKRRDLSLIVDGSNPISKYDGDNYDFLDKRVLIVDDILDSGSTIINAITNINSAKLIDVFVTYPLFSKGLKDFKKLVKEGKLNKIYVSDLIYLDESILKCEFIEVIDTSRYVSNMLKGVIK